MKKYFFFVIFSLLTVQSFSQALIISEFRFRGPNGANDEYVEIYNNSDAAITVAGTGTGYALVAALSRTAIFVIPNGTIIPARGHYLATNSAASGYSIGSYPAATGTATGNITFTTDIPDNSSIALFNSSTTFMLANRLDAVGKAAETNTLYKEGTGYLPLSAFNIDHCFYRKTEAGYPQDTQNNSADFRFGDTNGTSAGAGQFLGSPGPENLSSPIYTTVSTTVAFTLTNPSAYDDPANFTRDYTSNPSQNSTFGTVKIRFKVVNNTGSAITRLRVRIDSITTFPAPSGVADLRPITGVDETFNTITHKGTTLEQPPTQPNGGGDNSSMSVTSISTTTPLAIGATANFNIVFGVQQEGNIKIFLHTETLPGGGGPELIIRATNIALLPIVLSTFNVQNTGCIANLRWSTASEQNSSNFEVQQSNDFIKFTTIASVPAAGFSNTEKQYNYTTKLTEPKIYFRLKLIDKDGSSKLSNIVSAVSTCSISTPTVFPNPVKSIFSITGLSGFGMLVLYDNGKKIQILKYSGTSQKMNIGHLASGTYLLQIQKNNTATKTIKIIKE